MAYSSSQLDAVKNQQTRCSNCQTVFEVSRELLSSSDTRVRCGECLSIFDALEELRSAEQLKKENQNRAGRRTAFGDESSQTAAELSASSETAALDVTYSDFDLFSEEADLPEIAYFDQTRDTPDFDFDAVELGSDETFSDTLFVHDVTIDADATALRSKPLQTRTTESPEYAEVDFVADAQQREPLIFNYRDTAAPAGGSDEQASEPAGSKKATDSFKRKDQALRTEGYSDAQHAVTQSAGASAASVDSTSHNSLSGQSPEPRSPQSRSSVQSGIATKGGNTTTETEEQQAVALEAPRGASPWLFRAGMLMLLVVLLAGLFAYRTRPQLYNNATLRPLLEAGCKIVRCTIPARVDTALLKMVKRNVYSHPSTPNSLVINVSFRNEAEFAQQLPVLHMVLSNRVGRTVAIQDFSPPDYMPNWQADAVIDSNQQLDVKVEITDPGRDAQSFEFYFREFGT